MHGVFFEKGGGGTNASSPHQEMDDYYALLNLHTLPYVSTHMFVIKLTTFIC